MSSTAGLINDFQVAYEKYKANADYRETGSTEKALAFSTAINLMLGLLPKSGTFGGAAGENVQFDLPTLRMLREDAIKYASQRRISPATISYTDATCYLE